METIELYCWEKKNKSMRVSLTEKGERFWYPLNKVLSYEFLEKGTPVRLKIKTNDARFWESKGSNGSKT